MKAEGGADHQAWNGRAPIPCNLVLSGDSPHIRQVVTGFYELAASGVVDLHARGLSRRGSEWLHPRTLRAVIDGHRVIYDANDGWSVSPELAPYLASTEYYFKRAVDAQRLDAIPDAVQVMPLGLNYLVTSRRNLWHSGLHPFNGRRLTKSIARQASMLTSKLGARDVRDMLISEFEAPSSPLATPRVLFMCRTWPSDNPYDSAAMRADLEALNEMRAACIRAARAELGDRFYGGFAIDAFTQREYGDCLLPDHRASDRHAFLARVRESAVCVATTGLNGSIGWKMAEYVAASRAIVSEPLCYQVPGDFAAGRNFLEFTSSESFITSVERLLRNDSLRADMMRANLEYYRRWVRPDAQVLRTLERVLGEDGWDE